MAMLPIIIAPDPMLKKVCQPVEQVSDEIRQLLDDMLETMYDAPGIGLAAPQVGVDARLLVVDVSPKDGPRSPLKLINPEVIWESDEVQIMEEGCLSIPEQFADVQRPAMVRVAYQDETGAAQELQAEGLLSTCVQHEIDHLNGVLFVDHLSSIRRNMILRKSAKIKKARARDAA